MRNTNYQSLVQLLLIQIIFFSITTENFVEGGFFSRDASVKVYNGLGPGTTMKIHCKSIDKDLGVHYLGYKQHLDWSFGLSIFGNTMFWCDVYLKDRTASFSPFDMARSNDDHGHRDYDLCEPCAWRVTEDGAYRYDNKLNFETWKKIYNW